MSANTCQHPSNRRFWKVVILAACLALALACSASPAPALADEGGASFGVSAAGADSPLAVTTQAANTTAGMVDIAFNAVTSSYDITGDGVADTIRTAYKKRVPHTTRTLAYRIGWRSYYRTSTYYTYEGLDVYVNGTHVLSRGTDVYKGDSALKLVTLANGDEYLYVRSTYVAGKRDGTNCLYRYKDGKLSVAFNVLKLMDSSLGELGFSYGYYPTGIESVSGNRIKFPGTLNCSMVGDASFPFALKDSGGKLRLASRSCKLSVSVLDKPLRANRAIKAYKAPTGSKKAFTVKKGRKVTFKKIYLKDRAIRVQVKCGKRTGWIKLVRNADKLHWNFGENGMGNNWFKNAAYSPA